MKQPSRPAGLILDGDGVRRCWWCAATPAYRAYHDREWGFPVIDDVRLFEKICLEGFQAGLSWRLILERREHFRKAFAGFEPSTVARFDHRRVDRLLRDPGIVRHRGKIESAIHNARRAGELASEFGSLAAYFWRFEPAPEARPKRLTRRYLSEHPFTPASTALSRDLKQRGWRFVGPTTVHAFMQAMGLVNDHLPGCATRERVEAARARVRRPV